MFGLLSAVALIACSSELPPRPQLVVILDTDAPVIGQIADHPELSLDAAVDTVRVDVIDVANQNATYNLRDFVAPEPLDWPISFGVKSTEVALDKPVRLRIRAFRGAFAEKGELLGLATLEPPASVTIDRLVDLNPPEDGVLHVRILLSAGCRGDLVSFSPPGSTCINEAQREELPSSGVEVLNDDTLPPSVVGSWPGAREVECGGGEAPDRRCIPGGFLLLGDPAFSGIGDNFGTLDSTPLVPVLLRPFYLDATEMTVGRFRALVAGGFDGALPLQNDAAHPFCTWLGTDNATNDNLPLNCIKWDSAALACEMSGGALPSEAQWEHAARGRGRRLLFPWGDERPTCCTASLSRKSFPDVLVECEGTGIESVGSHPPAACGGLGDQSRDNVLDLAGSVAEKTADKFRPFSHPCWRPREGILIDPICVDESAVSHVSRGGSWPSGFATGASPLRSADTMSAAQGFRCAYKAGSQ
jgi:formylglycine-generating enzyme required for sulfatase activity